MSARRAESAALPVTAILILAAATRLIGLGAVPPALLPDEASNGYDAYCLLETGRDRWGASFPVLLEAFGRGDYRPALYTYLTVPCVALLGPERLTVATRLPAACGGVLTVACLYLLIARVCDRRIALWAALFLALSPWHIRVSRFGHESALTPLFPVATLLLLSRAGWPLNAGANPPTLRVNLRRGWMVAFGAIVALSAYSYASMRLFMPAMLAAGALIYRDVWRPALARRESRNALLAGLVAFALVLAPMARLMLTRWSDVNSRAQYISLFHQGGALSEAFRQAGAQYIAHFGPTWLFTTGDQSPLSSTPGVGQLNWYMLPLLLVGVVTLWHRRRQNRALLLVLAWLLLHPAASALCTDGPHTARAACGIAVFPWIAGIGAGVLISRSPVRPSWARLTGAVLLVAVLANGGWAFRRYVSFVRHPAMTPLFQTDLREAVIALRDRWTAYDRIFVSDNTSNEHKWGNEHPYILVLAYLPVEPSQFHAWEKDVGYRLAQYGFHYVESAGPFTFSTRPAVLAAQFRDHPAQRVLVVARPGDVSGGQRLHTIKDGRGRVRFELIEVVLR